MSHITVCICTFRRPALLRRLLQVLEGQITDRRFTYDIVVVDNDARGEGQDVVLTHARNSALAVAYCTEPRQNIALARNRAVANTRGDFIAFIDDDEFPADDWLLNLFATCERLQVSGVLGPVRPHFDEPPPRWIIEGGFCERREFVTGRRMDWEETRTGNVLFRREILADETEPFDPRYNCGGEDQNFFMRMMLRGHSFCWCNEAVAYETVPPTRWTRRYMLRRALLRGRNSLKHSIGRAELIARSVVAVPIYSLVLPVTLALGPHVFMKYCIRFCDHAGRILALVGLNPVRDR